MSKPAVTDAARHGDNLHSDNLHSDNRPVILLLVLVILAMITLGWYAFFSVPAVGAPEKKRSETRPISAHPLPQPSTATKP